MEKDKYIARLRKKYNTEIVDQLKESLKINNKMRVPKITKISINMGLGDAKENKNSLKEEKINNAKKFYEENCSDEKLKNNFEKIFDDYSYIKLRWNDDLKT